MITQNIVPAVDDYRCDTRRGRCRGIDLRTQTFKLFSSFILPRLGRQLYHSTTTIDPRTMQLFEQLRTGVLRRDPATRWTLPHASSALRDIAERLLTAQNNER